MLQWLALTLTLTLTPTATPYQARVQQLLALTLTLTLTPTATPYQARVQQLLAQGARMRQTTWASKVSKYSHSKLMRRGGEEGTIITLIPGRPRCACARWRCTCRGTWRCWGP